MKAAHPGVAPPHRTAQGAPIQTRPGAQPDHAAGSALPLRGAHWRTAPRWRHGGAAFYLVITSVALTLITVLTALHRVQSAAQTERVQTMAVLKSARQSVLAHLVQADLDAVAGRRLGDWGAWPDLPTTASGGTDATEPNLDGWAETQGCASRTWQPGQALTAVSVSGPAARCLGRLPWRTLGWAGLPSDSDADAWIPWVVVSPNLAAAGCWRNYHFGGLSQPYSGYRCDGPAPYPWIRVVDERGNPVSDRVAVALIVPGPPLPGQRRGPAAGPAAYLDRLTVLAHCPQPCQPGTYDNARYDQPNNEPMTLIQARSAAQGPPQPNFYAEPYAFNDRLVYITIDDLLGVLEGRARRAMRQALLGYHQTHGYYPFAASLADDQGRCQPLLRWGRVPTSPGTCTPHGAVTLPAWLTDAGWHRYFLYAVAADCVAGQSACAGPGLTLDGQSGHHAMLLSPGNPIQTPPYAPARGQPQRPFWDGQWSANPADYLDAPANLAGLPDVFIRDNPRRAGHNDRLESLP